MEPRKQPRDREDVVLSKWLESGCKAVECIFAALGGRLRTLSPPLLFRREDNIDNTFFTRCTLRTILRSFDWVDELEENVRWAGQDGLRDPCVANPITDATLLILGLQEKYTNDVRLEMEATHDERRLWSVASLTYRRKHGDISWLTFS